MFGRPYQEDPDPSSVSICFKEKGQDKYKVDKLRDIVPKKQAKLDEFFGMTQKEKDQHMKND